jgi:hypothetical protein
MHFNTQIVDIRMLGGVMGQGFTVAEADFENHRLGIAEDLLEVQCAFRRLKPVPGPVIIEGPLLALGQATLAQNIAADGSPPLCGLLGNGPGPLV